MKTVTNDLGKWTSDELLDEVVKRSADDRPALRLLESKVMSARLAEIDDKSAIDSDRSEPSP